MLKDSSAMGPVFFFTAVNDSAHRYQPLGQTLTDVKTPNASNEKIKKKIEDKMQNMKMRWFIPTIIILLISNSFRMGSLDSFFINIMIAIELVLMFILGYQVKATGVLTKSWR